MIVRAMDQLVIVDRDGRRHFIRLFPEMTAESVRKKVEALGVGIAAAHLRVDAQHSAKYMELLQAVWPTMKYEQQPGRGVGADRVRCLVGCLVDQDYYRALAKIAFHYFLVTSTRGFHGSEAEFEAIRHFVMHGGDHREFFDRPEVRFRLPEHEAPNTWVHLLAATEEDRRAVALVALFVGPRNQPLMHHISLGRLRSNIIVPGFHSFHEYAYSAAPNEGRFAGKVLKQNLVRVK
jgi:hypothetical protein